MQKFEKGRSRSISLPIVLHYNQKIANYSKQKQYQLACQSFEQMLQNHVNPDVVTYNTMINVYVKSQRLADAFALFDQMKQSNINPTIVTYTSLIDGCGKYGNLERALQVYSHVKKIGITLNMHFFNAILNATFLQGNIQSVEMILSDIKESDLQPNIVTYNTMLAGYIRFELLSKIESTIEKMISSEIEFNGITQTTILQAVTLVHDQTSLFQFINVLKISKIIPTQIQVTQLISELISNRFLILSKELCDHLISIGCQMTIESLSLIIELAGFFSNIDVIQWCTEKAAQFKLNMSFQIYLSQLCLFARFKNYEKSIQAYEQITFSHELIPSHVKLSLINCFLCHDDVQRSLNLATKWISEENDTNSDLNKNTSSNSSQNSSFSPDDADQVLSLFFERSLFNEVMSISQTIRDLCDFTLPMKSSNFTLLASIKMNNFSSLISSISEFSPSCVVLTEIINSISQNDLSLVPWNTLIDNFCSSVEASKNPSSGCEHLSDSYLNSFSMNKKNSSLGNNDGGLGGCVTFYIDIPSPSILCQLMRALCRRKMECFAWNAFKRITSIGAKMNEELLELAIQSIQVIQPTDENDVMYIINSARDAGLDLPEDLYTMGVDTAIKNGDYSIAISLKNEMDSLNFKLKEPTNTLFQQNYEYIKQVLPPPPPPVAKKARRRSRTMPTPNVSSSSHFILPNKPNEHNIFSDCDGIENPSALNNEDDGMDEITKRSVIMVLGDI